MLSPRSGSRTLIPQVLSFLRLKFLQPALKVWRIHWLHSRCSSIIPGNMYTMASFPLPPPYVMQVLTAVCRAKGQLELRSGRAEDQGSSLAAGAAVCRRSRLQRTSDYCLPPGSLQTYLYYFIHGTRLKNFFGPGTHLL